jgi:drug/metabolite transporter (DMT)-like permease
MAYDSPGQGLDGETKFFAKPIMMLLIMFTGMFPAYFFWLIQQHFVDPKDREHVPFRTIAILAIPSLCDLLCTLLLLVAQLYITASMWQMLRGTVIVITAILKRFVLGHRLRAHMWAGVITIALAMILVASASLFGSQDASGSAEAKDPRIGIVLVMLGCLAQGVQYVFEEKVMAVDNAPPLVVIGMEGLWGTILTLILVYPAAYALPGSDHGSYENPWDSIHMIQSSPSLQKLLLGFIVSVTIYNCMAVYVTKYLSAIWHAILDNFRPLTIWVLDLYIFYVLLPNTGFGEKWTFGSWFQLIGLLILFLGTAIYNGSVATCDHDYESISITNADADAPADKYMKTSKAMASPALARSPLIYLDKEQRAARRAAESGATTHGKGAGIAASGAPRKYNTEV